MLICSEHESDWSNRKSFAVRKCMDQDKRGAVACELKQITVTRSSRGMAVKESVWRFDNSHRPATVKEHPMQHLPAGSILSNPPHETLCPKTIFADRAIQESIAAFERRSAKVSCL